MTISFSDIYYIDTSFIQLLIWIFFFADLSEEEMLQIALQLSLEKM